ncbi:MAG: hypothetical protein JWM91_3684 [Rhodospirillales bacterium]|nr:hypothetical protein [Rhodospirillales bacterium]
MLWGDHQLDAAGDAWLALDEAVAFEGEHHLMDGRGGDLEMSLHIGFGWGPSEDAAIGVYEG